MNRFLDISERAKSFSPTKKLKQKEIFVGSQEISKLLGLTQQRVGQLVKEGLPREARNEYPVVACMSWYINYLRNLEAQDDTLTEHKKILYREKAERAKLENERLRGDTVSREEIRGEAMRIGAQFKESLFSLPGRLAPRYASDNKPAGFIKNDLQKEILEALNLLAERLIDISSSNSDND